MNLYEPMEIIVTPKATHIFIQHIHDSRRIFTDGRPWPANFDASFAGYAIGRWVDSAGTGRFDLLEVLERLCADPDTQEHFQAGLSGKLGSPVQSVAG